MNKPLHALSLTLATLCLAACGGGGDGMPASPPSPPPPSMGTMHASLTDAPSCGYDEVNVTITKIRVNQDANAGDSDAGWVDLDVTAGRVDLLDLQNGVLQDMGSTTLAPGHYTQMRLVLADNGSSAPYANSVIPTGGAETALTTPSAQTSGLKADLDLDIAANQTADIVVDFDACRSIVRAGNSGKYLLKPVIDVTPQFLSGARGVVEAALANPATSITLQQDGVVVKATSPDLTGAFTLEPVAPGTYDLVVTAPGRTTTVITGVTITADTLTTLETADAPLTLPIALDGTAAGTVSTAASPIVVEVDAWQVLANGDRIQVAHDAADADTGAYAMSLSSSAPWVAAWSSSGTLVFAADTTASNHYALSATDGSTTLQGGTVDIEAGFTVTTDFAF